MKKRRMIIAVACVLLAAAIGITAYAAVHGHGIMIRYEITHPCGFSGLCRSAVLRKDDVRGGNKNRRF